MNLHPEGYAKIIKDLGTISDNARKPHFALPIKNRPERREMRKALVLPIAKHRAWPTIETKKLAASELLDKLNHMLNEAARMMVDGRINGSQLVLFETLINRTKGRFVTAGRN